MRMIFLSLPPLALSTSLGEPSLAGLPCSPLSKGEIGLHVCLQLPWQKPVASTDLALGFVAQQLLEQHLRCQWPHRGLLSEGAGVTALELGKKPGREPMLSLLSDLTLTVISFSPAHSEVGISIIFTDEEVEVASSSPLHLPWPDPLTPSVAPQQECCPKPLDWPSSPFRGLPDTSIVIYVTPVLFLVHTSFLRVLKAEPRKPL